MVQMLNPLNLHMTFGLVKIQEENVAALIRTVKLETICPRIMNGPMNQPERRTMVLVQRLIPRQMKERRDKGFCYSYDEK